MKDEEESYNAKINQVFVYRGLQRMSVDEAECGDMSLYRYFRHLDRETIQIQLILNLWKYQH